MSTTLLVVQHVDREGPGVIAELARERGMSITMLRPDRGDPFPNPADCADTVALVLGGPMGVNERHQPGMEWLQGELDWLKTWHASKRSVLGICLGAQLLATAAGGSVEPLQVGQPPTPLKEVGLGAIHWWATADQEPMLQGLDASEIVLHWHGDRIRLPHEATLLGSSLHCLEQVFRIDRHAIGLQCHLELSGKTIHRWLNEDKDYVVSARGEEGLEELQRQWSQFGPRLEHQGRRLFSNVLDQWAAAMNQP